MKWLNTNKSTHADSSLRQRKRPVAVGVLAVGAVSLILAACGSSASPKTAGSVAAASTNGKVVIGSQVAPPGLDMTANPAAAIAEVLDYNVYQHLVELDPAGKLIPVLATSWTVTNGGTRYTFTIRSGVEFSNGQALTPRDVVYSIDRVIAPGSLYQQKAQLSTVKSVTAVGSDKVQVDLSTPNQNLLYALATTSDGIILDPSAVPQIATKPVGTGPYVFSNMVSNYSVTLNRNPSYWGFKPRVATVEWRYFSNPAAMNSALLSGQIDVIDTVSTKNLAAPFEHNAGYQVVTGPGTGKVDLVLNNAYGPLQNKLVRQAISYATNKQAIIDVASAGPAKPIGTEAAPMEPYYLNLASLYPYNPTKARQLLAQAGYSHGFSLQLVLPPYNYAQLAGPLVAQELKAVGIQVSLSNIQWPLWLSTVFKQGEYQATIVDFAAFGTVSNFANPTYFFHYSGAQAIKQMMDAAIAQPTSAGWIKGMHAVLRRIADDAVVDWLWNRPVVTVAKKTIAGLPKAAASQSFQANYLSYGGTLPSNVTSQGFTS